MFFRIFKIVQMLPNGARQHICSTSFQSLFQRYDTRHNNFMSRHSGVFIIDFDEAADRLVVMFFK